jgi:hypothetical protein
MEGVSMGFLDRLLGAPTLPSVVRDVTRELQQRDAQDLRVDLSLREMGFRMHGGEMRLFLGNLLHDLQHCRRADRPALLKRFLDGMLSPDNALPASYAQARALLMPVIRRRGDIGIVALSTLAASGGASPQFVPASQPLVDDLVIALVCDRPTSMAYVNQHELTQWQVDFDQALADALDNLRALPEHGGWKQLGQGVWSGEWGDAYDSSRILLPDLLFRGVASGNPLVMVPTRETLLLAPANDVAAQLAMLASAGQALRESPRWCSTAIYQVVDGRLDVYAPQHPRVCESLRTLERDVAKSDHADQKALLDKAHERDGKDIFVASFAVMEKDGRMLSCCTWTEGVSAGMLPKTDVVALVRPRGGEEFDFAIVDWETLWARHADLLREMPTFPTRYWIATFPTALLDELIATRQREPA